MRNKYAQLSAFIVFDSGFRQGQLMRKRDVLLRAICSPEFHLSQSRGTQKTKARRISPGLRRLLLQLA
jgi:hypothetical protein